MAPVFFIFPLVLLGLLVGSLAGLVWLWFRVFRMRRVSMLPTCGKCGYAVRGMASMHCPECGVDVREAGIVTPTAKGMLQPWMFLLWWTLFLPLPALVVTGIVAAFVLPEYQSGWVRTTIHSQSQPHYQLEARIEYSGVAASANRPDMTSTGTRVRNGTTELEITFELLDTDHVGTGDLELSLQGAGGAAGSMMVPLDDGQAWYTDAGGNRVATDEVDEVFIEGWFAEAGLNVNDEAVRKEVEGVTSLSRGVMAGERTATLSGFGNTSGGGSRVSGHPSWWGLGGLGLFWLLLYAGGIWLFFIVHRRQQRRAVAAIEEAEQAGKMSAPL